MTSKTKTTSEIENLNSDIFEIKTGPSDSYLKSIFAKKQKEVFFFFFYCYENAY